MRGRGRVPGAARTGATRTRGCTNTARRPRCARCTAGWVDVATQGPAGWAGLACGDVDECVGGGRVRGLRRRAPTRAGSFRCACRRRVRWATVRRATDVDECAADPSCSCAPQAECANAAGSFRCACADGYAGDGFACRGLWTSAPWGTILAAARTPLCANMSRAASAARARRGSRGSGVACAPTWTSARGGTGWATAAPADDWAPC